jgi:hypothetical protein
MTTRGSVIIATVFHGSVNTIGIVNDGANAIERGWSNALSYGIAAIILVALMRRSFRKAPPAPVSTGPGSPPGI